MATNNYLHIAVNEYKTEIFRFTSIDWLLHDIVQRENTLLSPRKWDDPYENALAGNIRIKRSDGSFLPYFLRNRVYGQCWTDIQETDSFWRMYSPDKNGVRLRSTIGKLYRSLERSRVSHGNSCFIGRVQYKSETEIKRLFNDKVWVEKHFRGRGTEGHAETLLIKRNEFRPESEIRLLYLDPHNIDYGDCFAYNYMPSAVISEITFDPRMSASLYKTYKAILRYAGYSGEVNKSTLYRSPRITISIP